MRIFHPREVHVGRRRSSLSELSDFRWDSWCHVTHECDWLCYLMMIVNLVLQNLTIKNKLVRPKLIFLCWASQKNCVKYTLWSVTSTKPSNNFPCTNHCKNNQMSDTSSEHPFGVPTVKRMTQKTTITPFS